MKKIFFLLCLFCVPLMAASPPIFVDNSNSLALEGYDVITYFGGAGPKIGLKTYQTEWQGAKWRFISAENMRRFEKEPERYAPQYGGYCPWAIAHSRLTGGLPNIWHVEDGKLYLMCSNQALEEWLQNGGKVKKFADRNWPKILESNE